jgi:large subunit ribosomal protein L3
MKFILGTKQKMTEVFDEDGRVYPVTVIKTGVVVVTQVKTKEKDGYESVQVGFGEKKEKKLKKPQKGHLKDVGNFRLMKEFKADATQMAELKKGAKIESSIFAAGDIVTISATSKGKGFQGVVKRHGFHGGPRSHGQKHSEREPGSIGTAGFQRVFKGKRMGGRMGGERVTVKGLRIIKVDPENNELLIKGAVPGVRGTLVEIKG